MKKIITTAALALALSINAQTGTTGTKAQQDDLNCYNKWAAKFEERGADEVGDGTYDDVIITVRSGAKADCFNGKVEVKEKKVTALYILREDGSYEQLKWEWKEGGKNITIHNGISLALITKDSKLVNVIWPKKIKAKKAPFKKAAEPTDD